MARPAIERVRWPKNHGLILHYRYPDGSVTHRFIPPGGRVTIAEAAEILGVKQLKLYRMRDAKLLEVVRAQGTMYLTVSQVFRLRSEGLPDRRRASSAGAL